MLLDLWYHHHAPRKQQSSDPIPRGTKTRRLTPARDEARRRKLRLTDEEYLLAILRG